MAMTSSESFPAKPGIVILVLQTGYLERREHKGLAQGDKALQWQNWNTLPPSSRDAWAFPGSRAVFEMDGSCWG